ncbi:recombination mediator RecR [Arcobacter sp. FWKO B]|uniref:recombination mediator RecR n=1 Tax=Arcobacter sp. FWKO B TaxID=2593672 RepID=UPI0018A36984|nr:recombination mediator RecR [Arcobacter sp. FWKO B]QOG12970.1 recombination protein RecR [Arcobacter sp. FWKO B]
MKYNLSKFQTLVETFEALPTIGKKTAQRLAYHIAINDPFLGKKLSFAIENAITHVCKCTKCGFICEDELCNICLDETRNSDILCIVQSSKDIFAIEETSNFTGKYFVIDELNMHNIESLKEIVVHNKTKEVLFAITPSLANEAFILFIEDKLNGYDLQFTKLAQGVPTGVSLENVDLLSLSKSIEIRVKA